MIVAEYFQLDEVVAVQQFAGQAAGAHGIFRVVAASGIGQQGVLLGRDDVEQVRRIGILAKVGAAHGKGDDFGTALGNGSTGFGKVFVLAGTH